MTGSLSTSSASLLPEMFPAQARRPQQQHQQHPPAAGRASEAAQAEGTRHPLDGEQQHGEHWEDSHSAH